VTFDYDKGQIQTWEDPGMPASIDITCIELDVGTPAQKRLHDSTEMLEHVGGLESIEEALWELHNARTES
jgi:hypothetical protein